MSALILPAGGLAVCALYFLVSVVCNRRARVWWPGVSEDGEPRG